MHGFNPSSERSRQRYTPYGTHRTPANTLDPVTQRGFLDQTEDNTTNLTYLNARYYDPNLTKFVSVDPLTFPGNPQTLNPYTYAANNPTTYSDPNGLCYGAAEAGAVGVVVTCTDNWYSSSGRFCGAETCSNECEYEQAIYSETGDQWADEAIASDDTLDALLPDRHTDAVDAASQNGLAKDPDPGLGARKASLNQQEWDFCGSLRNLRACTRANSIRQFVYGAPGTDGTDGRGNARQHILFAALLTADLGQGRAREVLDRHETIANGELHGAVNSARKMDLINNEIGMSIGQRARQEGNTDTWHIYRQVDTAVIRGPAVWISTQNKDSYDYKLGPTY